MNMNILVKSFFVFLGLTLLSSAGFQSAKGYTNIFPPGFVETLPPIPTNDETKDEKDKNKKKPPFRKTPPPLREEEKNSSEDDNFSEENNPAPTEAEKKAVEDTLKNGGEKGGGAGPSTRDGREEKTGPNNPPAKKEEPPKKNFPPVKDITKGESKNAQGTSNPRNQGGTPVPNTQVHFYSSTEAINDPGSRAAKGEGNRSLTPLGSEGSGPVSAASSYYKPGTKGTIDINGKTVAFEVRDSNISSKTGRPVNDRINKPNSIELFTSQKNPGSGLKSSGNMTITHNAGVRPNYKR
jgi:hypothetical protein